MNLHRISAFHPTALPHQIAQELSRWFDPSASQHGDTSSAATADWMPPVDILEYADRFVLTADIPGVDPGKVDVSLEKGVLSLSGSREQLSEAQGVESKRQERVTGRFFRRFALPDTVDGESVTAAHRHGVLEVIIPKRPATQPRRITVTH